VPEVEHVRLGGLPLPQRLAHLAGDDLRRGEDQCRVEVALHRLARTDPADGVAEGHPPVDPDDVGARLAHVVQQLPGAHAEVDPRHVGHRREDPGRVGLDELAVVGGREGPHPGVEQLDRARPGVDLHPQEGLGDGGEPVEQRRPQLRVAVHQGLGRSVILAGPALHEVAGEGEGGAGEPDERRRTELAHEVADCLGDVRDVLRRQRGQPVEVGRGAEGLRHDRADARHDVEVHADRLERHDDVGEEDGRVDAVAPDRLQRDLGDELRRGAGVQHLVALAQPAVLRQGAAGLAHEPHRRVRHRLPAAGPQEGRVRRRARGGRPRGLRAGGQVGSGQRGRAVGSHRRRSSHDAPGALAGICPTSVAPSRAVEFEEVAQMSMTWTSAVVRWCAGCSDERAFEVPPCEDGHGLDCLDLACVECGHAIVVGVAVIEDVVVVELVAA